MPLKNYTTQISATKSIGEINGILVAHGARAVMVNYDDDHEPTSLSFIVKTPCGELPFRLPANISAVMKVLEGQMPGRKLWRQEDINERNRKRYQQATRVGWRILKDWVDSQMAILETEMVTMEQIFLPYLQGKDGQTLYDHMLGRGFLLQEEKG